MSQTQVLRRCSAATTLFDACAQSGRTLIQRLALWRKMRETYAALSAMDDHQLADIGLNRSMIMNVSELLERGRR